MICNEVEEVALSNDTVVMANERQKQELIFQFDLSLSEFGTDNCVSHHICNDLDLYVDPPMFEISYLYNLGNSAEY